MTANNDFDKYLSGMHLYGDDFGPVQCEAWHEEEKRGYHELWEKERKPHRYGCHKLNEAQLYRYLSDQPLSRVLGVGSSNGEEFLPVIGRVRNITILESSEQHQATSFHGVPLEYVRPRADGNLPFDDNTFELIVALSTLHHIPTVSKTMREFHRCLSPGGYVLIREPIVSMGDWRRPRPGLTKNERGIPSGLLRKIVADAGFSIVSESKCMFPLVTRINPFLGGQAFNHRSIVLLDKFLSSLFGWNDIYHPTNLLRKLRPVAMACVLRKPVSV